MELHFRMPLRSRPEDAHSLFWNCARVTISVQDTQVLASLPPRALRSSLSIPSLYPVLPLTFSFLPSLAHRPLPLCLSPHFPDHPPPPPGPTPVCLFLFLPFLSPPLASTPIKAEPVKWVAPAQGWGRQGNTSSPITVPSRKVACALALLCQGHVGVAAQ